MHKSMNYGCALYLKEGAIRPICVKHSFSAFFIQRKEVVSKFNKAIFIIVSSLTEFLYYSHGFCFLLRIMLKWLLPATFHVVEVWL